MSTEAKIEVHAEVTPADEYPYLRGLFEDAEKTAHGDSNDDEIEALWEFANESMRELDRNRLRLPEPKSSAEAQRLVERIMDRWNLRGLIWGEIDLRARVDELLDEHEETFILPDGITRDDVVKKAQEMPSWEKDNWMDGSHEQWPMMADAVHEALHAIGAEQVYRKAGA